MSNRTSNANAAVAQAWDRERELVLQGRGTRDWTPEQQKGILEKGKAYDENGKAFEGHHMKSVESYPEYQADPDNIQFLSRNEHLEAHHGSFREPTNGYYDPYAGQTAEFAQEAPTPAPQVELSESIIEEDFDYADTGENVEASVDTSESIDYSDDLEM